MLKTEPPHNVLYCSQKIICSTVLHSLCRQAIYSFMSLHILLYLYSTEESLEKGLTPPILKYRGGSGGGNGDKKCWKNFDWKRSAIKMDNQLATCATLFRLYCGGEIQSAELVRGVYFLFFYILCWNNISKTLHLNILLIIKSVNFQGQGVHELK